MSAQDDESAPGSESESESESEVQTGSLVTQSLPHTYRREGLEFEVDEFRLDGTPLGDRGELNTSDRRLSLVDEANWETLSIDGSVTLDQETIQDVFPPDEWGKVPGRLVLVKTNPLGIHRSRDVLAEPPIESDDVSFSVEIDRTEYRGTLTVEPFLTRARAGDPGATNCASKVGARLADGVPWTVQLDDPTDGGGLLMPIIEDFGESDRLPDEQHIHHLSLDEPRNPQLFLNSEHQRVINILQNEGAVGGPPRLRDVLYGYIEHSVWTQLLVQTARDTDEDTGETEYDWQEDVLEIFLDDLYPDVEADQAAAQLATDVCSSEDLPDLMQRIEQAVHQRYDLPHDTTNLIEEAIQDGD